MAPKKTPKPRGTCIAPKGDVAEGAAALEADLCGAPATTTRVVEGLECALCAEHAREIDNEAKGN
jgi:hypothetical protein